MITIATPTRDSFTSGYTYDLVQLLKYSPDVEFSVVTGTLLNNLRTQLVHEAARAKASHILFIDSDMRFPPDTVEKLLARKKDIVGANYLQRIKPEFTARKNNKWLSSKDKTGVEEVETMGFGVMLIDMKVFIGKLRQVPINCFDMPFDPTTGSFSGEDVTFCQLAKKAGFTIWVDHDLSQLVKHISSFEFGAESWPLQ